MQFDEARATVLILLCVRTPRRDDVAGEVPDGQNRCLAKTFTLRLSSSETLVICLLSGK